MKAIGLLKSANNKRYNKLMINIREQFAFKIDVYPKTLNEAYDLLEARGEYTSKPKSNNNNSQQHNNNNNNYDREVSTGLQYAQDTDEPVPGTDGRIIAHIKCYACNRKGHFADFCPETRTGQAHAQQGQEISNENEENEEGVIEATQQMLTSEHLINEQENDSESSSVMFEFQVLYVHTTLSQRHHGEVDKNTSILIDTGSICSVFNNEKMLVNVRDSDSVLRAYTNGGHQDSTKVADLPGFFKVWFNPKSMLNILSFAEVRKKFRVTMDTSTDPSFNVHLNDGKIIKFVEIKSGLYLLDTSSYDAIKKVSGYSFLSLVKGNKANFSRLDITNADLA